MRAGTVVAVLASLLAIGFGVVFVFPAVSDLQTTAEGATTGAQNDFIERITPVFTWLFAGAVVTGTLLAAAILLSKTTERE